MDVRPDTSSGRSHDGWSFVQDAQAQSLHPSSHIRSDRSSVRHNTHNGSRSSFSRNPLSASTGGRSTTTQPSQPVLLKIESMSAEQHGSRRPRQRRPIRIAENGLPVLDELSIGGILAAIVEDMEHDVDIISQTLGRHRYMLAEEHELQMPPQGEIVSNWLQDQAIPEEEVTDANNVMVANTDGSVVAETNSESNAYRMLERLQVHPRPTRINSDAPVLTRGTDMAGPTRTQSSPAVVQPEPESPSPAPPTAITELHSNTLRAGRGPSRAVVSETYLAAEGNGVVSGIVPMVSEAGRHYPLYTHDNAGLFETTALNVRQPRPGRSWNVPDFAGVTSWFTRVYGYTDRDAEARLRGLLNR